MLYEGKEVLGVVKNFSKYGAFVSAEGVNGLLHIKDMSHKKIKHPSEVVAIGSEILVKVLKISNNRVSFGLKQLECL